MLSADATTVTIATLLFFAVPLIVFGPRIARFFYWLGASIHTLWISFGSWRADADMRAFVKRESEKQIEPREIEAAAHEVHVNAPKGRQHADVRV